MYHINFNNIIRIVYILYNVFKLSSIFYPQNNPMNELINYIYFTNEETGI